MAGNGKKWLMGCGLGCGIPVLLAILLSVGGSIVMLKPFNRAVDTQKELSAAYGDRADFVPDAAGLRPERLEKFIAVREALMPMCEDLSEISRRMQRVEDIEKDGEEPSKSEAFKAVGDVMGAVFGLAGNIGRFTEARNKALLEQGMGLGEYMWIYTLAYHSWLGRAPNTGPDSGDKPHFSDETQGVLRELMRRHAGALSAAGDTAGADLWSAEADRLERTEGPGVPWAGSELPAGLVAGLAPFRDRLEALYCPASATFEFSQLRKRGLSVTSH